MATVGTIIVRGCSFIMVKGAGVVDSTVTLARLALKGTCNAVHDLTVRLSRLIRFMFWPRISETGRVLCNVSLGGQPFGLS